MKTKEQKIRRKRVDVNVNKTRNVIFRKDAIKSAIVKQKKKIEQVKEQYLEYTFDERQRAKHS